MTGKVDGVDRELVRVDRANVGFSFAGGLLGVKRGRTPVVQNVSFTIARGETLGVVGESGSGKSTLGRMLVRLLAPNAQVDGTVTCGESDVYRVSGRSLRSLRKRAQMVFQDPNGSLNPRMTVAQTLGDVLKVTSRMSRAARRARIAELLELVGLHPHLANRQPHEFSGGQRQRIAIARALAAEPQLLVCDEPVAALDVSIQAQVLNLLLSLQKQLHLTIFFIAHDIGVVRHVSDRIIVMYLGKIVEVGDADVVYTAPRHPYTVSLIAAIPEIRPAIDRVNPVDKIKGDLTAARPVSGCRFRDRCWLYEELGNPDVCADREPELVLTSSGSQSACHFPDGAGSPRPDWAPGNIDKKSAT